MTDLRSIYENPYRMLGVFANSGMREIVSQKNRISSPRNEHNQEIPLDLEGSLPPVERSVEKTREAYSLLTLPNERLKHTQFWFLKMTPNDGTAFQSLYRGDIEEAVRVWENEDSLSSIQNRMLCRFLQEDIPAAIEMAEKLYALYGDDYRQLTLPNVHLQMGRSELVHQFIDTLGRDLQLTQIIDNCHDTEWCDYIRAKCSKDILSAIEDELRLAENADPDDATLQKKTAELLMERTAPLFAELKKILPSDDVQYCSLADEVGTFILDGCTLYYMSSTKDISDRITEIQPMLDYAQNLVCGENAASRLNEFISFTQSDARVQNIMNSSEYQSIMEHAMKYAKHQNINEDDDSPSVFQMILSLIITIILMLLFFVWFLN